MSRVQQDQFIDDDEEETCPLCVEELDLTDRSFKPCPCGYQICQFCYHSIKNNMNGLCPACRRPYNDADIERKNVTPEEIAAHKARQAQKQKKTQAALQKEKQKAEADTLSRKHLAGLRVVQKNLVYVTGLTPTTQEDQLLQVLRGTEYFGAYGKIIKIVVSKAKDPSNPHSVGVYITYERKEDAATCIQYVNGSQNGDRILRAQFGTTKYCSAYLRGETCTNRSCMFLHEPGEANESYSRADLSALNAGSTQRGHGNPPPPQSQQPVASASQPMARQESDQSHDPATDRPALPSTASWASKSVPTQPSRAESRSTSGTIESPASTTVIPVPSQPETLPQSAETTEPSQEAVATASAVKSPARQQPPPRKAKAVSDLAALLRDFNVNHLKFSFGLPVSMSPAEGEIIKNYPPLFDVNGGAPQRLRRQREEEQRRLDQELKSIPQPLTGEADDNLEMGGSLQLGGEPEERQNPSQPQSAIQPPMQEDFLDRRFQFGGQVSPGVSERGLATQHQQQLLLQRLKSPNEQGQYPNNLGHQSTLQQPSHPPGHQRNASRYSFANESSASTNVKPVANPKLLNQQSSIMPQTGGNHFGAQNQAHVNQFFTSNVQGPPPGLKTTGTPPVSGGMTFGQGHGFATGGLQYGANVVGRNANEEMMRNLLRGRETSISGGGDPAKRELHSFSNYSSTHNGAGFAAANSQTSAFPPGPPSFASLSSFSGEEKQRKKKGKKHRHGNTSSSSGPMDVAGASDPTANHLLQTRIQHGGGFGGQGTGAANPGSGLYPVMHGNTGYGGRW